MKMKTFLIIVLSLGLLSSCGYKVLDKSSLANFNIVELNSSGDNKINFFIKNKLKNKITNSKEENEIIIDLKTVKTKNIKEKNISNQITKYEIIVVSTIKVNFINKNISKIIQISSSGDYDVVSNQAKTINNQDILEKFLAEKVSEKILNKLIILINDL
tara:strand:- start:1389 stop:1865 length:477 start_codon:yes stop_codon:yes gene_type:complete